MIGDETTDYIKLHLIYKKEELLLQNTCLSELFTRNIIGMKLVRNKLGEWTFVQCWVYVP